MPEQLSAIEAVRQIAHIRTGDVDIEKVLGFVKPHHAHLKKEPLITGEEFNSFADFITWQESQPANGKDMPALLWDYLDIMGIDGVVSTTRFNLDSLENALVDVDTYQDGPLWNPANSANLLHQIDFQIDFELANSHQVVDFNKRLLRMYSIELNTCRIAPPIFRPHAIGHPTEPSIRESLSFKQIVTGQEYLNRMDLYFKSKGLRRGINGIVVTSESARVIKAFNDARVERPTN
jgi:hypothetical protein